MTEDLSIMDKKNFSTALSSKNQGPDPSRSRQDGSSHNAKLFPRSTRRKESPTGAVGPCKSRMESTSGRKPTPQKSKAMDKRPRPRSGGHLQPVEEHDGKFGPEMGSLQAPGSKKQNLNHLLNFHFAPRENRSSSGESWRSHNTHPGGGWRTRNTSGSLANRPKFSKENFLQANCQFLVKCSGDYTAHRYNPDILVEWELVEQINIHVAGEFPSCPICLEPPVAAKMTKCGHIFCWPCLLHYLALSDKKSRKCPICYELICKEELKSVVATHWNDAQVGEEIEMQLMVRQKGCFEAMPLMCKNGATFNWESVFKKIIIVTPKEVEASVLDRENNELMRRYREDKDCPEVCFIEEALRELDTRRSNVQPGVDAKLEHVVGALNLPAFAFRTMNTGNDSVVGLNESGNETGKVKSGLEDTSDIASEAQVSDDCFFFYQAIQGENIFLHPLNMAMLWKAFGSDPTVWPQVLQMKVIEKESVIMMDDMRKRLKFLNHLPITSNVQLVEAELTSLVPDDVLLEFGQQLEARKKRRLNRVKEEKRRERRQEAEERKKLLQARCPPIASVQEFPAYLSNDVEGFLVQVDDSSAVARAQDCDDDVQSVDSFGSYSTSPSTISFAKVASKPHTPAVWGPAKSSSGVTGDASKTASKVANHTDDTDPEDYVAIPTYRMSMSDAIAKAIAQVKVSDGVNIQSTSSSQGKRKGRKKGKVLFTTGMDCTN